MRDTAFEAQLRAALLEAQNRRWGGVSEHGSQLVWSSGHQRFMDRVLADPFGYGRRQAAPQWRKVLRRAGQIAACLLLAVTLTMTAVPQVRAWAEETLQTVWEWFTDHVVYRFQDTAAIELGHWRPSYIPESYIETVVYEEEGSTHITYETEDGAWFDFDYTLAEEGIVHNFDNEHSDLFFVDINGRCGHLYVANTAGWPSYLLWLDETEQISYFLMGELPKDEMLRIAESVAPQ